MGVIILKEEDLIDVGNSGNSKKILTFSDQNGFDKLIGYGEHTMLIYKKDFFTKEDTGINRYQGVRFGRINKNDLIAEFTYKDETFFNMDQLSSIRADRIDSFLSGDDEY